MERLGIRKEWLLFSVWAVKVSREDLLSRIAWAKIIGKSNLMEWWVVLLVCIIGR